MLQLSTLGKRVVHCNVKVYTHLRSTNVDPFCMDAVIKLKFFITTKVPSIFRLPFLPVCWRCLINFFPFSFRLNRRQINGSYSTFRARELNSMRHTRLAVEFIHDLLHLWKDIMMSGKSSLTAKFYRWIAHHRKGWYERQEIKHLVEQLGNCLQRLRQYFYILFGTFSIQRKNVVNKVWCIVELISRINGDKMCLWTLPAFEHHAKRFSRIH